MTDATTDLGFDGKVAIITGAGGGLGKQHALMMAQRGALIVVNDLGGSVDGSGSDKGAAQLVVDEIQAAGRIHRLGQTRRVLLKKFIMKGTVEEAIEEFHSKLKTGVFKFSSGSMPKAAALLLCSK